MSLAPVILQAQQVIMQNNHIFAKDLHSRSGAVLTATTCDNVASLAPSRSQYSQLTLWVRSPLEKIGVYRRKVVRYRYLEPDETANNVKSHQKENAFEADEISIMWKIIGFGITLIQERSYGRLFPSLNTYPVGVISDDVYRMIRVGSVQDLQKMFISGAIHPFLRDSSGCSLLHVSCESKHVHALD